MDQELDICILTETWLNDNISDKSKINDMTPNTHNLYHMPRKTKIGGGVGMLINKVFKTDIIENYPFVSFEYINLKITYKNRSIQIVAIYRPPNMSRRGFLSEFGELLDSLNDNRNILICGDFNLHMDNKSDSYVTEFNELLESHNLENTVNEPTSLSNHIIDLVIHIKTSKLVSDLMIEPECDLSPVHKLVLFNINIWINNITTKRITYRNKTNFDAEEMIDKSMAEIRRNNLQCECIRRNPQTCVCCFTKNSKTIMTNNYNNICPEETKDIIVRESAKWYNRELREAKKNKRKMEDRWKRSKKI